MEKMKRFEGFGMRCGGRLVRYERPAVMGILNVTADSFFDRGGYLTDKEYLRRAAQIAEEGADIIDIGVVSTRPGAQLLEPQEEARRLARVVEDVRRELPEAVISVDTCFSLPAKAAVEAGADIINDISGGAFDQEMFETVARLETPYILMHNLKTPDRMQDNPQYEHLLREVVMFFSERIDRLRRLGVKDIIIDPGFGFSKTLEHNYELFRELGKLRELFPNEPLLVAVSRKSMIYKLLGIGPEDALTGTTVLHTAALMAGAQMIRVHDVKEAREVVRVVGELGELGIEN